MTKIELIKDMLILGHTFDEINNDSRYLSFSDKFEDSFEVARKNSSYLSNVGFKYRKDK